MMKSKTAVYIIVFVFLLSVLFLPSCSDKSVTPSVLPDEVTDSVTVPQQTPIYQDWLFWVIIGSGAAVIGVLIFFILKKRPDSNDYRYDRKSAEERNKELQRNLNDLNKKIGNLEIVLNKYEANKAAVPVLVDQYRKAYSAISSKLPNALRQVYAKEPDMDYGALKERIYGLTALQEYLALNENVTRQLKEKCKDIAESIKQDAPEITQIVGRSLATSDADGYEILHQTLAALRDKLDKKPINPVLLDDLKTMETTINNIRDYSYRLIPSRLIKFCHELIELPAPQEENNYKEKTVREILGLINQYLKL